jgi:hypothetical protein
MINNYENASSCGGSLNGKGTARAFCGSIYWQHKIDKM